MNPVHMYLKNRVFKGADFWYNRDMKYLMYYLDGFIKKFPLDKSPISIGRISQNDLAIEEDSISRKHVQINVHDDHIMVKDLKSTNGIRFQGETVSEAPVKIGNSFCLGRMEFILKEGSLDEFKLAEELIPIFNTIDRQNEKKLENEVTRSILIQDSYNERLIAIMQAGLRKNDFNDFLMDLSEQLSGLTDFGSLYMVAKEKKELDILFSIKNEAGAMERLKKIVTDNKEIFTDRILSRQIPGTAARFYSYPVRIDQNHKDIALISILSEEATKEEFRIDEFLSSLSVEISLLSQLLTGKENKGSDKRCENRLEMPDEIVTENKTMKELVKQAKKIAGGAIFVLIQGESGTGKELFARLIHNHSKRDKKKFVAINCAAIPENLLESELFGHEKGAFTGAYAQKKGKLELASGGTLVLDEIGDMPVNLQSKLLRALQEKEFYRLGGAVPIIVDLRIISITNQDLKQLIEEGKFREDLYFRLVHRTITIPPLRERKEDISVLINYFTNKFCRQNNKTINGYSVKAFEALLHYHWKGNVRQLENEIHSIVNLTDYHETVSYDILSDEIKYEKKEEIKQKQTDEFRPVTVDKESEKDYIIKLLEKHDWNKSETARTLGMTYRGLHKKLKKMGIDRPKQ